MLFLGLLYVMPEILLTQFVGSIGWELMNNAFISDQAVFTDGGPHQRRHGPNVL